MVNSFFIITRPVERYLLVFCEAYAVKLPAGYVTLFSAYVYYMLLQIVVYVSAVLISHVLLYKCDDLHRLQFVRQFFFFSE